MTQDSTQPKSATAPATPQPPADATDFCCGIIPIHLVNQEPQFLLVKHNAGHWAFPKGHPETGETELQTALRECLEETQIRPAHVIQDVTFDEHYRITKKSGKTIDKTVRYFIGLVDDPTTKRQTEEIADLSWGNAEQTRVHFTFDAGRRLFQQIQDYLSQNPQVLKRN